MAHVTSRLADKVAIVTGSSRGIGEAIAKQMAREGAKVVLAARKLDGLQQVADAIRAEGGDAIPVACHLGKLEDVDALVKGTIEHYGKVDVLVNNAATNPYFGPMLNIDWSAWDKTYEVNVKGPFQLIRAVVQHLYSRNAEGSIINVGSVAGLSGAPLQGVYGMTKASMISMTRTLAVELGGAGIRVNAIAPGLVETKFAAALTSNDDIKGRILDRQAVKRVGEPQDIAGIAVFMASDESRFMTGQTVVVDGGWTVG